MQDELIKFNLVLSYQKMNQIYSSGTILYYSWVLPSNDGDLVDRPIMLKSIDFPKIFSTENKVAFLLTQYFLMEKNVI